MLLTLAFSQIKFYFLIWNFNNSRKYMSQVELQKKLLSSRKELLDIGLRNNLINFNPGSKSLRVVDELSIEVLNILYRKNRTMTFLPVPKAKLKQLTAGFNGDESSSGGNDDSTMELLQELENVNWSDDEGQVSGEVAKRHVDTKLQTALTEERLFLSLLKIHTEAETYIQEQGVNILFLALGFLHWYEADSSDKPRRAPLLLLPVSLSRVGAKDNFKLDYTGDDLIQNLSLAAKLKTDFKLNLPEYVIDASTDADEMPPLENYYNSVAEAISSQKRWKLASDEIHLGFFSFGKFLMFNDLNPEVWPEGQKPGDHPVLNLLLGDAFREIKPVIPDGTHLDSVISPGEVKFVKDADSSQTLAIIEAREGRNLVIQGPPGTGKSQTITNIISDLLGQGKSILFVSEKMAALEVVKRRLDESHLGDAVLELHSHKATKQSVLKELGRTLEQGRPFIKDGSGDLDALKLARDELNSYAEAVNLPIGKSQVTFIHALGHYLNLKRKHPSLPVWPFDTMKNWSQHEQLRFREKINELDLHLKEMGRPVDNPFWGCSKTSFSPIEQEKLTQLMALGIELNDKVISASSKLAEHVKLLLPVSMSDVEVVCRAAQRAAEAPQLNGITLTTDDWQSRRDSLRALINAGQRMSSVRTTHELVFIDQAWDQDFLELRQDFSNYADKWWRIFSGKFRQSKAKFQGLCKTPIPTDKQACLLLIDDVLQYQQQKKVFTEHALLGETLFGAQWLKEQSDWEVLSKLSQWIFALYDEVGKGEVPKGILEFLQGDSDPARLNGEIQPIRAAVNELQNVFGDIRSRLELNEKEFDIKAVALNELHAKLSSWLNNIQKLYLLSRFNQIKAEMIALGLKDVVTRSQDWDSGKADLTAAFDYSWFAGLVELSYASLPALAKFDNIKQTHLIEKFRKLDKMSLAHAQAELAKNIWDRQPNKGKTGEMAVIQNELNKKRRLMPIRQLMNEAGRAIQQIKPVFMMSPMSIANFLPPGKLGFDVVIFDEASQVKAVDAFGAILRGKQTIVVGDTRQMPPTNFFGKDVESDDEDNVTSDIESILSMFRARGVTERYLSWHYRSRHESLIAISNVEFYDRRLVVFPSSGANQFATGLSMRHLPHALYDRGRTRTNREEAKVVAESVCKHAREKSNLSLGVVAFSMAQRDLIQVEVELLRRKNPELDSFFTAAHPTEPFFVKNLENVQGDERDVIMISIGYGRNESGRIAKEFGPVNREGGERRLNVLVSRAKMAMEVFCNFVASDLELDANATHGVRALKHFLHYAETGDLNIPLETGKQIDSPFELEVKRALEELGYKVEPQVGTAGYFIDLAVKDPKKPGRYVIAIECDGASYHSARSARDRDRLRQSVLESLGWRFHRIWSTDWFRNPVRELDRAVSAIELALSESESNEIPSPIFVEEVKPVIFRSEVETLKQDLAINYYVRAILPNWTGSEALHEVMPERLASFVALVANVEAPVHEANITKRLLAAFGVTRAGNRIVESIDTAIQYGHRNGLFHYHEKFIYQIGVPVVASRNRSRLDSSERKIEHVSNEEIDLALMKAIELSFSIHPDFAISAALENLGFGRATLNIAGTLKLRIEHLMNSKKIKMDGDKLIIA
ncbi:DUF3320 domain-containing protein [Undibacterium sp. JH2W]|uniref:DUF3320 domain-containing protein n=1 Tax=Undibacterium sp. JH2W TaxID=3413037 RepID=UPI003BF406ED